MDPEEFGVTRDTSRDPGSPNIVAATYMVLVAMIQLLLVLRLTGTRAQFLAMPACSPGRHLHGMVPRTLGEPRESSAT